MKNYYYFLPLIFVSILTPALAPAKERSEKNTIQENMLRIREWQNKGVTFVRPDFVLVDADVKIGPGTTIGCGVHLLNGAIIGADCVIEPFCIIDNSIIENGVTVYSHTVIQDATVALASAKNTIQENMLRIREWQNKGVTFVRPDFVLVDADVKIGPGTTIGCGVHLINGTIIGADCVIEPFCIIDNSIIENGVTVYSHTVIQDATVKLNAKVGPFARIRKGSIIESQAEVGNFVEMSDSTIGQKSKAKHLTYLGCTTVEQEVNIGAGTITCNYDGFGKHKTLFKRKSFIGSNSTFVAPITVGEGAITASGSVFTKDIPDKALGIARSHQTNKEGYAKKLRRKFKLRAKKVIDVISWTQAPI